MFYGNGGKVYTDEENEFIRQYTPGHTRQEIIAAFKEKFDYELTIGQLRSRMRKVGVVTGNTGRFGDVESYNKGKKMSEKQYAAAKPTMFKKGNIPPNRAEVGKEVILEDGYIKVKIAQPNKWKLKHYLVWEEANGPVPPKSCIIFLDRNGLNCELDNLRLVDKKVNQILNRNAMLTDDPELNKTLILVAEYMAKVGIGTFEALEKSKEARLKNILKQRKKEGANG